MAVSSLAVPPDPRRDARALVLAGQVGSWPRHTLKVAYGAFEAGTTFRRAYGSNGARYLVNSVACQCPDYAEAGFICKHIRAYVLWEQSQQPPAAPRPRVSYEDVYPSCKAAGCDDDPLPREDFCHRHVLVDAF